MKRYFISFAAFVIDWEAFGMVEIHFYPSAMLIRLLTKRSGRPWEDCRPMRRSFPGISTMSYQIATKSTISSLAY